MSEHAKPLRAVLLAAGQGKRMKSERAKVLHDVLGRSILHRVIGAAEGLGVQHVHIVVGHAANQIDDFLKNHPPRAAYTTHLQEPQLGTGHALMQVTPSLKDFRGNLVVCVGDAPLLTTETLAKLVATHEKEGAVVTVLTTDVDDPKNYGRIIRDKSGAVTGIVEDKDANDEQRKITEINTAIYALSWPEIDEGLRGLKNENAQGEFYLTDLVGWASGKGIKLAASKASDWKEVAGVNSRIELAEVVRHLRDRTADKLALESGVTIVDPSSTWIAPEATIGKDSVILPGTHIMGDVTIGSDCVIGPNSVIKGTVKIGRGSHVMLSVVLDSTLGDGCKVGPFAHVREGNTISNEVRVGNFVELKKSNIGNNTNVSHLSYVGDTTIGSKANVGAGTITANYDHITKKKFKTVIGDGASTGSNSVLVAPVTLEEGSVVGAGSVITKDIPAHSLGVTRSPQKNVEGWANYRRAKGDENKTDEKKPDEKKPGDHNPGENKKKDES
jgi:UDP-N-acetylglucosamine diphosphorylase/glucosamine-1-phosphate N-acetyltransferase